MAVQVYTPHDTMQMIRDAANKNGEGGFRVKIYHKSSPAYVENIFASFLGATLEQVETFEEWLPHLSAMCPGQWIVKVCEGIGGNQIGGDLKFSLEGAPRKAAVEWKVLTMDSYTGPRDIKFPPMPESAKPMPIVETTALPTNTVGSNAAREAAELAGKSSGVDRSEAFRLQQIAVDLQRQEKALEEQRNNMKLEAIEQRIAARFERAAAPTPTPAPQQSDSMMMFMMEMLKQQKEDARAAQVQQAALLERLLSRPPENNAVLERILEKLGNTEKDPAQKHVIELIGTVSQMSSQMIASQAELLNSMQGPVESPGFKLAQQGLMTLQGILASQTGQPQLALPAGPPQAAQRPPQAFAGHEEEEAEPPRKPTKVEELVASIYRKEPIAAVYKRFKRCAKDEEFLSILGKHGGNWTAVAQELLGPWLFTNVDYVQTTLTGVLDMATADGITNKVPPPAPPMPAPQPEIHRPRHRRTNGAPRNAIQTPVTVEAPAVAEAAPTVESDALTLPVEA